MTEVVGYPRLLL